MIIDETYNLEDYHGHGLSLQSYNTRYVNRIMTLTVKDIELKAIFIGIDLYLLITDNRAFTYYYSTKTVNKRVIELVGMLRGVDVYLDHRLKNDQVVIGNSVSEVEHYIITKGRKEKLKKIQENI